MALKLTMMKGGRPFALDLPDGQFVIGRDSTAAIVIDDPSVSVRHAELTVTGSLARIRDLGSGGGTWINGIRLADQISRIVTEADRIQLGDVHLAIGLVGAEARSGPAYARNCSRSSVARDTRASRSTTPRLTTSWGS